MSASSETASVETQRSRRVRAAPGCRAVVVAGANSPNSRCADGLVSDAVVIGLTLSLGPQSDAVGSSIAYPKDEPKDLRSTSPRNFFGAVGSPGGAAGLPRRSGRSVPMWAADLRLGHGNAPRPSGQ